MAKTIFLPGAGGSRSFWAPVAERLQLSEEPLFIGWPGFGDEPPDPTVQRLSDLVDYVLARVDGPFDLVSQSMGGVVAMLIALREPQRLRRLVMCGTSGGIDLSGFELEDSRADYLEEMPESTPRWFVDDSSDLTDQIASIGTPTLLIWGAGDCIVPPAAGRMLAGLLPDARIVVVPEAGHAAAQEKPDHVAGYLQSFLSDERSLHPARASGQAGA